MKRIWILLALCLLLTGCGPAVPRESAPAETREAEDFRSYYVPDSPVEKQTGGAVRAYPTGSTECLGVEKLGDGLLLLTRKPDGIAMIRVSGEEGTEQVTRVIRGVSEVRELCLRVCGSKLGYYDSSEGALVVMDSSLEEQNRFAAPKGMIGLPLLSEDLSRLFYRMEGQIRELNLGTGKTRLLREQSDSQQELLTTCFRDELLLCRVTEEDGESFTLFLSTIQGEAVDRAFDLTFFSGHGQAYYAALEDDCLTQRLFGRRGEETKEWIPGEDVTSCFWLPESGRALALWERDGGTELKLYSLETGMAEAGVFLETVSGVRSVTEQNGRIWLLADSTHWQADVLLAWDAARTPLQGEEPGVCLYYTAENPDGPGLAACQAEADRLGEKYGLKIILDLEDFPQPQGDVLTEEYRVRVFHNSLGILEKTLEGMPEDFFRQLASRGGNGTVHLGLGQSLRSGSRCRVFRENGTVYIQAVMGSGFPQELLREVGRILDSFLLERTGLLDDWAGLNPRGFAYGEHEPESRFLQGKDRAFTDEWAMTTVQEDRASIWSYGMMDGNQEVFSPKIMQKKLSRLCKAIRAGFGWEDRENLPWEQYLPD